MSFLNYFKSERFKERVFPEVKRFFAVFLFTLVYGVGVAWFLEAIKDNEEGIRLYTGGIPGVAQLVTDIFYKLSSGKIVLSNTAFSGIFIIIANIPILLLGWFKVSKKFTIYSLVSVITQSTIIGFIPVPEGIGLENINPLVAAVIGGLLIGAGTGGALKFGTSTGGLDIISQYVSLKNGKTVGVISMFLNVTIAIFGGIVVGNVTTIAYTVIRILISTVATDKIHISYQFLSVDIITSSPKDMCDSILQKIYRGVTLIRAEGAYSHHEKTIIYVVISVYETNALLEIVRKVDSNAFIVTRPVKNVYGNFKRKAIA